VKNHLYLLKMSTTTNEQISTEENSSSRHSTPNSSRGERQFQFGSNNNIERGSSQNSRTSSVAESTGINTEGFSNYTEILQHLQTAWNHHNNIHEGSRRLPNDETVSSHYSKGHSQQHYPSHHHQNWSNYGNRRTGGNVNYSRGYNDGYWNPKNTRFQSHRTVNSLMSNSNNYQQQQSQPSPPTQRRQGDIQQQYHHNEQSYYKKNRSEHDRRPNGYHSQHSSDYNVQNLPSTSSDLSSTQSFPSNLNSYNR
jgi:hypothetical protein